MRTVVARLLACALATCSLTLLPWVPASAAPGDVVTFQWDNADGSGSDASTQAGFEAFGASSSTSPGGARFTIPSSALGVRLAPPTGKKFVKGQLYNVEWRATSITGEASFSSYVGTPLFPATLCTQPSPTAVFYSGQVNVLAATYDADGALTELAADYHVSCRLSSGVEQTVEGSVRHGSDIPYLALSVAHTTTGTAVGSLTADVVHVRATGTKRIVAGAATLSGDRAADYRVTGNGCEGVTLTQGVTCDIALAFQPQDILSGNQARPVTLSLSTPGHVVDTLRIRLADLARRLPPTPTNLTTFPVSSGLGVSWSGTYYDADAYRLERRTDGGDWTTATTATASRQTDGYFFVDHDTAPGQHVAYRVFAVASGLDSVAGTVEGTRPVASSTPTSTSSVAFLSNDDRVAHATVVDGQDGGTVVTSYNGLPRINASARDSSGTVTAATGLTLPFLPGPGEYRVADRTMGADFSPSSSYQCSTWSDRVLEVRALEYDDTGRPVLLDASWVGRCAYGTVSRVEVRLGVDTPVVLPKADPDRVGQLRTYAGRSLTRTVTVTNPGPSALTLGQATTRGDAAADWSVVGNGCQAVQLLAGETCDVTVQFAFSQAGTRPAALEVSTEDAAGALAPVTVPLDGFGTTPPPSELMGTLTPSIHAMLAYWNKPYDDGGEPVTSYEVERQVDGGAWTRVADVDATVDPYRPAFADKEPAAGHRYSYRVRARNAAGAGAWNDLVFGNREVSERGVVVSGSRATTGPRGLFQVAESDWYAPIVPLTDDPDHDYRDPASSPGGARLVFSRSVGDGSDDEYDLWTGTRTQPAGVRVTTMSGAERDAQFSPDTTRIAFTHESAGQRSVWVVDADGGNARQVRADAASPAWTPDGSGLVVEDDFAGDAPLLRLDLAAGTATPIAGTGGGSEPDVSRSGNLAYADANGRIMQLAAGQTAPTVLKTPSYDRRLSAPVYARNGDVLVETTRVSSGRSESEVTSRLAVVGEPGLLFDDHRAPTVAAAGLRDAVAGSQSFSVTVTDNGGTPDSALRPECRLDGAAWSPCGGPTMLPSLTDGRHVYSLRVADEAGLGTTTDIPFWSDTTAPSIRLSVPSATDALAGRVTFAWDGSDAATGVDFYEVSVRTASPTSGFGAYHLPAGWTAGDVRSSLTTTLGLGQEMCVRVRSRDRVGLYSPYTEQCTARPLDDRSLRPSTGWKRLTEVNALGRTTTTAARRGVSLATAGTVTARRIGVLATTCRTCGSVKVYVGSTYVGTAKLTSSTTRARQMKYLPLLAAPRTGRVTLRTTSSAPVRVDGLLLGRS